MTPRPDLFTQIHKGIRSMLYDAGARLQSVDFTDRAAATALLDRLDQHLTLLHEHGAHEDAHYFPPLRTDEREVVHLMTDEHQEIQRKIASVRAAMAAVLPLAGTEGALEPGARLNRTFNHFMAYYLRHMNHEEETALPAMWRVFTDGQLLAMRGAVLASIPPARYAEWLRWMLPSLNDPELVVMFRGLTAGAQPEMVRDVVAVAEKALAPERWSAVRRASGL
jgi:hemerythrin-like domain-containing protein